MPWEIAEMLAAYREAPLYQVMAWDRDVIERMFHDHNTFRAFKHGCPHTRWSIYHALKYAAIA